MFIRAGLVLHKCSKWSIHQNQNILLRKTLVLPLSLSWHPKRIEYQKVPVDTSLFYYREACLSGYYWPSLRKCTKPWIDEMTARMLNNVQEVTRQIISEYFRSEINHLNKSITVCIWKRGSQLRSGFYQWNMGWTPTIHQPCRTTTH